MSLLTFHLPSACFFQTSKSCPVFGAVFHRHLVGADQISHVARLRHFRASGFPTDFRQAIEKSFPQRSNAILCRHGSLIRRKHNRVVGVERHRFAEILGRSGF